MSPADRNETATRAEEYVLGLLTPHEAAELEARLAEDRDLRADVAAARDRFLEIDLHAEPLPVDPALWDRIVAGLDGRTEAEIVPFALRLRPLGRLPDSMVHAYDPLPPVACSVTSTSEAITIEQSKRFHAASSSPRRYGCRPFSPTILNTISAVKTTVKMTSNTLSRSVQSCGCS